MPAIENANRRGATYWWRRRVRVAGRLERPITIITTVSLLTKDQSVARRRAAAMTGRSEVVRMSLYERIEQEGLLSEQVNPFFREEMVRYCNAAVNGGCGMTSFAGSSLASAGAATPVRSATAQPMPGSLLYAA